MSGQTTNTSKRRQRLRPWATSALLALSALQCGRTVSSNGTETHWQEDCEVDANDRAQCGNLSCVCGVCSMPCITDDDCGDAPEPSECAFVNDRPGEGECAPGATRFCRPIALDGGRELTTSTGGTSGGSLPSTTGDSSPVPCDSIEEVFGYWCGTSACHGDPSVDNASAPPYLFPSDPSASFVDVPAVTAGCEQELLIDSMTPEKSLMLTSVTQTSPCGVRMPAEGFFVNDQALTCIEQWVYHLAAMARDE